MKRWIGVLCFLLAALVAGANEVYKPLSIEEARQYVTQNPEAAAEDIVKLDAIEHAQPAVQTPAVAVVVAGADAAVSWPLPIDISIAGGALHYSLTPEPILARGVVPTSSSKWWEKPLWGLAGAVAGGFLGAVIVGVSR